MDVAGAVHAHCFAYFVFKIAQIGDRCRSHVGNAVRHGDLGQILALTEHVAGFRTHRHGGCSARRRWRGAGALHAGIHIGFVVVADVQHIVVAFEHAGQAAEADVGGTAVAALCHHPHIGFPLHLHRRRDTGGHRRRVAEQRMDPRHLPG